MSASLVPERVSLKSMVLNHLIPGDEAEWRLALRGRVKSRMWEFGLTERQQSVCWLLMDGRTHAEIAAELGLAEQTVKHHISGICERIWGEHRGYKSRYEIMMTLVGW